MDRILYQSHTGHEFVLCLRGTLEYQVEDQHFVLSAGDSLLFAAKMRHRWRNPGKTVTNAVFVLAGFEQGEHPSEFHIISGLKGAVPEDQNQGEPDSSA